MSCAPLWGSEDPRFPHAKLPMWPLQAADPRTLKRIRKLLTPGLFTDPELEWATLT